MWDLAQARTGLYLFGMQIQEKPSQNFKGTTLECAVLLGVVVASPVNKLPLWIRMEHLSFGSNRTMLGQLFF